jgi:hypothetical protein
MIWILVATFILTDAAGLPTQTEGNVLVYSDQRSCERARAELRAAYAKNPAPNRVLSVGCARAELPVMS